MGGGVSAKIFKGALWLTISQISVNALGFVSTIVLARLLSPADFGIVAIATSILAVGLSLTDMSLGAALIQREEVLDEHFHTVWSFSIARSLVIFVVIAILAFPLAQLYDDPNLAPVILMSGLTAAIPGFASPTMVMFTRDLVFWQDFVVRISGKLIVFLVSVGLSLVYRSYWAIVFANLSGSIVKVVISYLLAPYRPRLGITKFKELFSFSFWVSMGNAVNTLNWRFDQIVLGFLVGKSALGIYTVADNLSALPVRETTAPLRKTLFPAFARMADDPARLKQAYIRTQTLLCAIAFPIGFGFGAVAEPVVVSVLGAKWHGAVPIIQILSGTFAFQALSSSLEPLAMAKDVTRTLFGRDVRTFLIRIPFIITGYFAGGLMGVVIGRAMSSAIGTIWNMSLVKQLSGITVVQQFLSCWRIMLATATMIACTMAVQSALERPGLDINPIVVITSCIGLGGLSYVASMAALWLISGKQAGVETELLSAAAKLLSRRWARKA